MEHDLAKVGAAGSSPVSRSSLNDGKLWFTRFSIFFYCNVKINYTFLLITQCFFKAFLRICEWGFRLNLLCFHSDPHITDIHQMNGLNFHLSNHFHPLFSIFSFFLYLLYISPIFNFYLIQEQIIECALREHSIIMNKKKDPVKTESFFNAGNGT